LDSHHENREYLNQIIILKQFCRCESKFAFAPLPREPDQAPSLPGGARRPRAHGPGHGLRETELLEPNRIGLMIASNPNHWEACEGWLKGALGIWVSLMIPLRHPITDGLVPAMRSGSRLTAIEATASWGRGASRAVARKRTGESLSRRNHQNHSPFRLLVGQRSAQLR
jgi:hypothetical protein